MTASRYEIRLDGNSDSGDKFEVNAVMGTAIIGRTMVEHVGPSIWNIVSIETHPGARGVGVGDAMMTFVLDEVRRRGGSHVSGTATPGDRQLKNLFERHGLTAKSISVGRNL